MVGEDRVPHGRNSLYADGCEDGSRGTGGNRTGGHDDVVGVTGGSRGGWETRKTGVNTTTLKKKIY